MLEAGNRARLAREPLGDLLIGAQMRVDDLQRDVAL